MQEINIERAVKERAVELLENGTVGRVIGWTTGEFAYDMTPAVFTSAEEIENGFIYNDFCGANLSKYVMKEQKKDGDTKILVFLKPCDTYSFEQLVAEHKINRENVYVVGISCDGKADVRLIAKRGIDGITGIHRNGDKYIVDTVYGEEAVPVSEVIAERCKSCKSKKLAVYDEIIGEDGEVNENCDRFDMVEKLEAMTAEERYEFWRGELSRCIRCNACRNVCPACTCEQCVFDNPESGISQKAAADSFEENMFHIIRAYHVAGRCTDCGECSRVCPEQIPLHLLNRKLIKDMKELYGDFKTGEERTPLTSFTYDDAEPSVVRERGNA